MDRIPWDSDRWPNFSPDEKNIACPCCGEFYLDEIMFDCLQLFRFLVKRPVTISSGHRCVKHNSKQPGSSKNSEHLRLAFDTPVKNQDRLNTHVNAVKAGFKSFGFYMTFLHMDRRPGRIWYSSGIAKAAWIRELGYEPQRVY